MGRMVRLRDLYYSRNHLTWMGSPEMSQLTHLQILVVRLGPGGGIAHLDRPPHIPVDLHVLLRELPAFHHRPCGPAACQELAGGSSPVVVPETGEPPHLVSRTAYIFVHLNSGKDKESPITTNSAGRLLVGYWTVRRVGQRQGRSGAGQRSYAMIAIFIATPVFKPIRQPKGCTAGISIIG